MNEHDVTESASEPSALPPDEELFYDWFHRVVGEMDTGTDDCLLVHVFGHGDWQPLIWRVPSHDLRQGWSMRVGEGVVRPYVGRLDH